VTPYTLVDERTYFKVVVDGLAVLEVFSLDREGRPD